MTTATHARPPHSANRIATPYMLLTFAQQSLAQQIHMYETSSDRYLWLYGPLVIFVISLWSLFMRKQSRRIGGFLLLGSIAFVLLTAVIGAQTSSMLIFFLFLFSPWPVALVAATIAVHAWLRRSKDIRTAPKERKRVV